MMAALYLQEDSWYAFLLRVNHRAIIHLEGLDQLKNPVTHCKSNLQPSDLGHSGSTNYSCAFPLAISNAFLIVLCPHVPCKDLLVVSQIVLSSI
jgi:hypothetical protein